MELIVRPKSSLDLQILIYRLYRALAYTWPAHPLRIILATNLIISVIDQQLYSSAKIPHFSKPQSTPSDFYQDFGEGELN